MSRMLKTKHNGQRGSVTVEAAIAFTGFLFVIFTILGVINVCRVQMLVSSALDTAAKEMAQYSYFYKMSGLQKFSKDLSEQADVGKAKVNEVVGSVDDLFNTVVSAKDGTVEDVTNLANATSKGTVTYQDFENTINGIKENGSNVMSGVTEVEAKFKDVAANPMTYVRSLVAIAGETGLDMAKSRMLAVPLGRMFFQKHFGDSYEEASETLERLGVVDGLEGMNFNMSTIFDSDHPEDIRLAVYYKVKMINFLSSEDFTLNFCKQATVRGWLAGDSPIVKVNKNASATEGGDASTEGGDPGTEGGDSGAEDGEETTPTEETTPVTEPTEETVPKETVDLTNSQWHPASGDEFDTNRYFIDFTHYQFGIVDEAPGIYLEGYNEDGIPVGCFNATDADSAGLLSSKAYTYFMNDIYLQKKKYDETNGAEGHDVNTEGYGYLVVYVPENISDEEYDKIVASMDTYIDSYRANAEKKYGFCLDISIQVQRGGGNYDYGSEG